MSTVQSGAVTAAGSAVDVEPSVVGRTPWQLFWGRFKKDKVAFIGLGFIVFLGLVAIFAPVISAVRHIGPNQLFPSGTNELSIPFGPNGTHWFGYDQVGRDVFIRTIYGARTSLTVAILATGISVFVGIVLGLIAGFFGGAVDTVISRTVDIVMSLPILLLAIGLAAVCGTTLQGCLFGLIQPGMGLVVAIIALFNWTYMARIVRGQTLSISNREF